MSRTDRIKLAIWITIGLIGCLASVIKGDYPLATLWLLIPVGTLLEIKYL